MVNIVEKIPTLMDGQMMNWFAQIHPLVDTKNVTKITAPKPRIPDKKTLMATVLVMLARMTLMEMGCQTAMIIVPTFATENW